MFELTTPSLIVFQNVDRTMSKAIPTDLPMHAFASASDFDAFMEEHHESAAGFYLKLAKKSSGIPSVSADEAIEVGLCYGWIDGWGRGIDEAWYFKRYTPRRAKSIWSQKNVATVARLDRAGRMRPAGMAAVVAAKTDGRWERAYAGPATIQVPDDFNDALKNEEHSLKFFNTLNKSDRYSVLWRIQTASPSARAGRIQAMLELLERNQIPGKPGRQKESIRAGKGTANSKALDEPATGRHSTKHTRASLPVTARRSNRLMKSNGQ